MTSTSNRSASMTGQRTDQRGPEGAPSVAVLDQALWRDLNEAASEAAFGEAWVTLLCRMIPGAVAGVLVLERGVGSLVPVAGFPAKESGNAALLAAAQLAVTERRGAVQAAPATAPQQPTRIAYPIILDEQLVGAVALEFPAAGLRDTREAMRQLQWSVVWVRDFLRRGRASADQDAVRRMGIALDLLAAALEEDRFTAACRTAATELATRLGCTRVSFGFLRRGQCEVESISNSAQFGKRMNLVRLLAEAMDEAVDQHAVVLYPPPGGDEPTLTRSHAALAAGHGAGHILTVPMFAKDKFIGAVTFERDAANGFDQSNIDLAEAVVSIMGPALADKRANDRWLITKCFETAANAGIAIVGPGHAGLKFGIVATIAVAAFCYFATGTYRVTADGKVEGEVQRSIVAPFDGYVSEAPARAGHAVQKGDLLVALDDRDLLLERLRWVTERQQHLYQYDKALSAGARSDAMRYKSELDEAEAQIQLADAQLARSRMKAPFDGLILSGDLSQSIGAVVRRGDVLFEIAPLSGYRVKLLVPESQIADVAPGGTGDLVVGALPDTRFPFTVEQITPVATARDGQNFFAVEGRLTRVSQRLRPGMDGVGKIDVGERRLVWIWFRSVLHWLKVATWRWVP
jgi:multidrug efflux pump subunit AcrA (membrane-fusion protein)